MSKKPCQLVINSLEKYQELKKRLWDYFFQKIPLNISNTQFMQSYTNVYDLINDSQKKLKNQKTYQVFQTTYSRVFRTDLQKFAREVKTTLLECKVMTPEDHLSSFYREIVKYTRFLHYSFRSFMVVEKNSKQYSKTSLFHQGLNVLKEGIIQPLYDTLFSLIVQNIELFKNKKLKTYNELQYLVQLIGACGFTKYKSIRLQNNYYGQYSFSSINKQNQQKGQIEYETDFFKKKFTNEMVKYLQKKYTQIANEMIKLSTPEYVQRALDYLEVQEEVSQFFYPNPSVKTLLIRSIQEILINDKCEELIKKPKTGLPSMIQTNDVEALKNLYKFVKKTSHQKILAKHYQHFIESKVQEQFLSKITVEEEKMAKKQVVSTLIDELYQFYMKIDKISHEVIQAQKDSTQLLLSTTQSIGFQTACNKNNIVGNFLVYYADYLLKKPDTSSESVLPELVNKINKITKFLYSMDAFLKFYQKLLGVRMLYDTFKNKEVEYQIIGMLKNQVGVSSMNKINSMVGDYRYSDNFNQEKIPNFKNKLKFNLQVMILTVGCWQIHDHQSGKNRVPPELLNTVELYEQEYSKNLANRLITWIFNYGRAILQVKFDNNVTKILMVNNYQLLILLHFQRYQFREVKVSQLLCEIKPQDQPAFLASLNSLAKVNVLMRQNKMEKITKDEKFAFNKNFKSNNQKVGCYTIPKFNEKATGQKGTNMQLDKERANLVDAAIVKLMKSKRVATYQELINQVCEVPSMNRLFKPSMVLIKQRIESCIQRDFVERDDKDRNTLIYKP